MENTHLATDIQGDNKLYVFEWADMPNIIDSMTFNQTLLRFKRKNLEVVEGLKQKLLHYRLVEMTDADMKRQ